MPYYPPAGGSGAPSTATYITQTADGTLSAEQALGLLATGLLKSTTTTGVVSIAAANTDYAAPLTDTIRSTDAALAMAVNTIYYWDISGLSADRTATLPGTAAVGDMCGLFITTGDDAFEVPITATAGDTLNGVAGGTEWSRLFITNEFVLMRCTVANTTWVVVYDGRVPMTGLMSLSGSPDGESGGTYTAPTAAATPGSWSVIDDVGNITQASAGTFTVRRACRAELSLGVRNKDNGTAGQYVGARLNVAGVEVLTIRQTIPSTVVIAIGAGARFTACAIDDVVQYQYITQAGSLGLTNTPVCFMGLVEVL